jgi:hypothetical protein
VQLIDKVGDDDVKIYALEKLSLQLNEAGQRGLLRGKRGDLLRGEGPGRC